MPINAARPHPDRVTTPTPPVDQPPPPAQPPPQKQAGIGVFIAAALVVVGCVAAGLLNHSSGDNSDEAKAQCESWVSDQLVSPGSAKFSAETAAADDKVWTVTGTVDSQNLFGGLVRNEWTCVVRDDGQTWTLESLTGLVN